MITESDDYFRRGCGRCGRFDTVDCSVRLWATDLRELRRICLAAGLEETVKWGHPCYMHAGRNIAIIGAFRGDVRLTFFNAALMKDSEGILERQGANALHPSMIRFDQLRRVADLEPVIRSYIAQAQGYADAGILPAKEPRVIDLPDELVTALDCDPELAEAFFGLTPGRQRGYALNLGTAKKPETRYARIAKFRTRILAGKGVNER
ncbi:YdeI/OmpD-associated family protein [Puniceibacterium confluentis]|uniref:YdeI/OmpD-associated family protein n=1 Tax=Puniceibacterium confluentis TaxID=1958944 RepID=UPI0011B7DE52|nr:YdeI/OmpD-associated family protein [Puniceibacterium confluentis]